MSGAGRRPVFVQIVTIPLTFRLLKGHVALVRLAGFDVHGISSPGPLADEFARDQNVTVHAVPMRRRISLFADVVSLVRLCLTLRRLRPDVVQSGTPKAGLLGTIASYLCGVPTRIYYVHGLRYQTTTGLLRMITTMSERIACAAATQVVCVGPSIRTELVADGLCPPSKAAVIGDGSSNGVDTDRFNPARVAQAERARVRERFGIPEDGLIIGFIGRLGREKGLCELQRAWSLVRERHAQAHLLIIGPPEQEDPLPDGTMEAFAGDPRVHLAGEDWNTPPLYAAMDVFCLPSHREGCPNVLLEAASMALPVVAFSVPGVIDAAHGGVTGRFVPPLDTQLLADALGEYLADSKRRANHGAAGRRFVVRRFDRKSVWAQVGEFYRALNGQRRATLPVSRMTTEQSSALTAP